MTSPTAAVGFMPRGHEVSINAAWLDEACGEVRVVLGAGTCGTLAVSSLGSGRVTLGFSVIACHRCHGSRVCACACMRLYSGLRYLVDSHRCL